MGDTAVTCQAVIGGGRCLRADQVIENGGDGPRSIATANELL